MYIFRQLLVCMFMCVHCACIDIQWMLHSSKQIEHRYVHCCYRVCILRAFLMILDYLPKCGFDISFYFIFCFCSLSLSFFALLLLTCIHFYFFNRAIMCIMIKSKHSKSKRKFSIDTPRIVYRRQKPTKKKREPITNWMYIRRVQICWKTIINDAHRFSSKCAVLSFLVCGTSLPVWFTQYKNIWNMAKSSFGEASKKLPDNLSYWNQLNGIGKPFKG